MFLEAIQQVQAGKELSHDSPPKPSESKLSLAAEKCVLMYKKNKALVWAVPKHIQTDVIYSVHDRPFEGQQGTENIAEIGSNWLVAKKQEHVKKKHHAYSVYKILLPTRTVVLLVLRKI